MTNPIIERAARAMVCDLWAQQDDPHLSPDKVTFDARYPAKLILPYIDQDGVDCVALVRAVLQAIREPSIAMLRAGEFDSGEPGGAWSVSESDAERVWQAMIDAALSE